tara:strand:- start:1935 stop:3032 length:1098 start_codon:yes stop_codon:yes gene_type:complete
MENLFKSIYKDRVVLVTGHTGFKGSWLVYWLAQMGAKVIGYSLEAPTNPNHIELLKLSIDSVKGDIRDQEKLNNTIEKHMPDIVFHLAAQPLVRYSYTDPVNTYETNVIGTLKVFESCKKHDVKSIVNITSDKAYENKEWERGYKENDSLGGYDPYSSSKGCADLLANSYRNSFFNINKYKETHNTLLASCRAGNVIGGGDWAKDRLMSDIMRAVAVNKKVSIRNPEATRPWQHVLEPLSGYLLIGQKLLQEEVEFADAWNFGPSDDKSITVHEVLSNVTKHWDKIDYELNKDSEDPHEAKLLKLDCSKANKVLNWREVWDKHSTFKKTVNWYRSFYEEQKVLTESDLKHYVESATSKGLAWTKN